MKNRFAKILRSKPPKKETEEQQSTERKDSAQTASNDDSNDNEKRYEKYAPSKHGILQVVSSKYLVRRRLVNILEERFPGRWALNMLRDVYYIELPEPLSPEDLEKCGAHDRSSSTE